MPHPAPPPIFGLLKVALLILSGDRHDSAVSAEKTLCERRLPELPQGIFHYQRIELEDAAKCAERCVEDWEFCRSAALLAEKAKSYCQLYGQSFESRLPLDLPAITSRQTDPQRLLPVTLVELTEPPCSSKFSREPTILGRISKEAKQTLEIIPSPAPRNRLELGPFGAGGREEKEERHPSGEEQRPKAHHNGERNGESAAESVSEEEDKEGYLESLSSSAPAHHSARPPSIPPPSASSLLANYAVDQPAPLVFPALSQGIVAPAAGPIQPTFVSRGQYQFDSLRPSGGCRNGNCPIATAPHNPFEEAETAAGGERAPCAARKSTDPCAPQPQWLEWTPGSCSASCGSGWRERRRYCSSGRQEDCKGEATDREKCTMPACNQWGEWGDWSRCSSSCGGGQSTRRRMCRNGKDCEGPAIESKACGEQPCPTWASWGEWGECSASCGQGGQRRIRECVPPEQHCAGLASEFRECELRSCPVWEQWGQWSSCSKSCGSGESVRRRECKYAASADECRGPAVEHLLCNTQPCPAWTPWAEWAPCSKSCGDGATRTRKRECRYNGLSSEDCPGPAQDEAQCRLETCPAWTEWAQWSDCSTSCGHGRQTSSPRSRQCKTNGVGCAGGDREVRFCQRAVCPYFSTWTEWGGCSVTCGRGFCERRRECIRDTELGGKRAEGERTRIEPLREGKGGAGGTSQPEDITADTLRPHTLEVAQSSSVRRAAPIGAKLTLLAAEHYADEDPHGMENGNASLRVAAGECLGPDVDRKPCDAGPCCGWSEWSPWGNCRVSCGLAGHRERTRKYIGVRPSMFAPVHSLFAPRSQFVPRCGFCVGESQQTESCAIPEAKGLCDDENEGETKKSEAESDEQSYETRAKPKPELPPMFMREQLQEKGAQDKRGHQTEEEEEDDYKGERKEEAKREMPATEKQRQCAWSEWSKWSECGGGLEKCHKSRSRFCNQLDDGTKCTCPGEREQSEQCAVSECLPRGKGAEEEAGGDGDNSDEEDPVLSCYWTDWTQWSHCDSGTLIRNRTRLCVGLKAVLNGCQCMGASLEQSSCKGPNESEVPPTRPVTESKSAKSAFGIIKRVQLIPRLAHFEGPNWMDYRFWHKMSEAERKREEERRRKQEKELAEGGGRLRRLDPAEVVTSRDQPQRREECDKWQPWGEWGGCKGRCGSGQGQKTRKRKCVCERSLQGTVPSSGSPICRGCAGIAEETVSCPVPDCPVPTAQTPHNSTTALL